MTPTWATVIGLLLAVLFGGVLLAGALLSLRRQRQCPACDAGDMRTVAEPTLQRETARASRGLPSYEVLRCDACGHTDTLVHGNRSRFGYCPSCRNRSLLTAASPQAPPFGSDESPGILVTESCQICGFQGRRTFPDTGPPKLAEIIPFPIERRASGE